MMGTDSHQKWTEKENQLSASSRAAGLTVDSHLMVECGAKILQGFLAGIVFGAAVAYGLFWMGVA